jgi:hypothetical protein
MKTTSIKLSLATTLLLSTLNFQLSTSTQGSLTPPGASATTMKTLAQIQPLVLRGSTQVCLRFHTGQSPLTTALDRLRVSSKKNPSRASPADAE